MLSALILVTLAVPGQPAAAQAPGTPEKEKGSTLTVCTDETNIPRTTEEDVAACFAKGTMSR